MEESPTVESDHIMFRGDQRGRSQPGFLTGLFSGGAGLVGMGNGNGNGFNISGTVHTQQYPQRNPHMPRGARKFIGTWVKGSYSLLFLTKKNCLVFNISLQRITH